MFNVCATSLQSVWLKTQYCICDIFKFAICNIKHFCNVQTIKIIISLDLVLSALKGSFHPLMSAVIFKQF